MDNIQHGRLIEAFEHQTATIRAIHTLISRIVFYSVVCALVTTVFSIAIAV